MQKTPPEESTARTWDESYQQEVADKLKQLSDELATMSDAAMVRRRIDEARRHLPQ